jgi:hypothetical protein
MKIRRKYPETLQSHKHHAFELVGFTVEDFELYCEFTNKSKYIKDSKKDFFTAIKNKELMKKENKLYFNGEEILCKE